MFEIIKKIFFLNSMSSLSLAMNLKKLGKFSEVKLIFSALSENNSIKSTMFVGGCVRKIIRNEKIDDIDIATTYKPKDVVERLTKKGFRVIETGISHGTVTALLNDKKFEITTLRKDITTDGRHADVDFIDDWTQDASRRDFTINAIYSNIKGKVFDPFNGVQDLNQGYIKFIGDSNQRISEDYLRILRYLRFFSQYSKNEHDPKIIKSIKKNLNGMNKISKERKIDELIKILSLKDFFNIFYNEDSKFIILNIFPELKFFERFKRLKKIDKSLQDKFDMVLLLAILTVDESDNYQYFSYKYNLSNKIKNRLNCIQQTLKYSFEKNFYDETELKKLLYYYDNKSVKDIVLFSYFANEKSKASLIKKSLYFLENQKKPVFPITSNYLVSKYAFKEGPKLGKVIKQLEGFWIKNNFKINNEEVDKILENAKKN
ncbi:MAG: hypothetical protein CBC24_05595 [Candidatus Pelagibacter sp. TMED64]|nr:poly(A) polymerase [Candidatus Pelagibacter sp.]OUU65354.1 MAG: hypothetical protein CBC24_05595 [Candidatus Pelagibacter sp. TMED64]|tara:strand:+ start:2344 stop:3636 length:1293 start_codon:yes stop_codon:yes gene_type:complete